MNNLQEKIKNNLKEIKPRPRWIFVAMDFLKELIIIIFWILAVIGLGICTYILFNNNTLQYYTNITNLFFDFPWEIIFASLFLILGIFFLSKKISISYRLNSAWLIGLIIISVFIGYIFTENFGINDKISETKLVKYIYQNQGRLFLKPKNQIIIGKIKQIDNNIIYFEDADCNLYKVDLNKIFPKINNNFTIEDRIKIIGIKNNYQLNIKYISKLLNSERGFKKIINLNNCNGIYINIYEN